MFVTFLHNAIRFSTVFLFGSTGETLTEKSGHLNMGIPGTMCFGALGGIIGESIYLGTLRSVAFINPTLAVLIPMLTAMLFAAIMGLLYSFLTVTLRCNQNVTGLTITTYTRIIWIVMSTTAKCRLRCRGLSLPMQRR